MGKHVRAEKSLSREQIKYLAVLTMTLNHAAHLFFSPGTRSYEVLVDIGYFTAVTMCFFLVEGYHHTGSKRNYALRMLVFACIAQLPYMLAFHVRNLNMLFTLLLCLGILAVREYLPPGGKQRLLQGGLLLLTDLCDWQYLAAFAVILFDRSAGDRKRQARAYGVIAAVFVAFEMIEYMGYQQDGAVQALVRSLQGCLGILASGVVVLGLYRGRRSEGHRIFHKWFFYVYYPAHLLILYGIRMVTR